MEIGKQEFNAFRQEMRQELRSLNNSVSTGFGVLIQLVGETNARVEGLGVRLDETNARLRSFRAEVTGKLNGVSKLLLVSEKDRVNLDNRVTRLEKHVDGPEESGPAA